MLKWKTSQLGFPLERPVVITEIWQDRHRSVQNSHTLRMGRDWPVKPTILELVLAVLDAQRELNANEDLLAQRRTTQTVNLIALYKALGGG
jgi:hypothetical protein